MSELIFTLLVYDDDGLPWRNVDRVPAHCTRRIGEAFILEADVFAPPGTNIPKALGLFWGSHRIGTTVLKMDTAPAEGQQMKLTYPLAVTDK